MFDSVGSQAQQSLVNSLKRIVKTVKRKLVEKSVQSAKGPYYRNT